VRSLRGVGAPLTKFVIFAVAMLLFTAALAATIANQTPGSTTEYSAKFTDVTGVNKGDEVRIAGVRVGEVDDIKLVDRKVALIDFSVAREVVLPRSVQATIRYRNLIGQRYINLSQGVGRPGERLVAGATIPLDQTHPAVNLTQLFDGFKPLFQALSPEQVNQLSFELIQVLQGEGGTINSLLSHTASLTTAIADKDRVIGEVIDNLNQVLDTVNARDKEFTQLVITVRELIAGLSADRDSIGDAISSLGDLTDATAGLLHDARPPLKADIDQVGRLAGNLNDNQELVDRFLHTLPGKLDTLIPVGSYGSWFNFYLCDLGGTFTAPPPVGTVNINVPFNTAARCYANNAQPAGHDKHHGGGR
jgi:phospholipid/cholesterol/gamma-HCH transport system substrate-binding protein